VRKVVLGLFAISCLGFGGCMEGFKTKLKRDGGFISNKADYIIVNTSGNRVLDIYKLRNVFVSNQESSDGVGFIDIDGNYTLIQGDVKVIRIIEGQNQWNEYKEYHFDKDFSKTLK